LTWRTSRIFPSRTAVRQCRGRARGPVVCPLEPQHARRPRPTPPRRTTARGLNISRRARRRALVACSSGAAVASNAQSSLSAEIASMSPARRVRAWPARRGCPSSRDCAARIRTASRRANGASSITLNCRALFPANHWPARWSVEPGARHRRSPVKAFGELVDGRSRYDRWPAPASPRRWSLDGVSAARSPRITVECPARWWAGRDQAAIVADAGDRSRPTHGVDRLATATPVTSTRLRGRACSVHQRAASAACQPQRRGAGARGPVAPTVQGRWTEAAGAGVSAVSPRARLACWSRRVARTQTGRLWASLRPHRRVPRSAGSTSHRATERQDRHAAGEQRRCPSTPRSP
jgi:hypothetical protein